MSFRRLFFGLLGLVLLGKFAAAQRIYAPSSVLSSGKWYKIAVDQAGVYKIDIPFLNSLGINTSNLSTASIRLFGNGGGLLPESNSGAYTDDLFENAILVADGGDGLFNGPDYLLFYAPGPHQWTKDSLNHRFDHRRNIYSDKAYYFLSIGGNGKRIQALSIAGPASITVTQFDERIFHELDTVNFLSSGKQWYGEELSALPGRSLSRSFNVPLPNVVGASGVQLRFNAVARSVGNGSRLDVSINGQPAGQFSISAVGGGIYDLFAQEIGPVVSASAATNNNILSFNYSPGSFNAQAWINWFELFGRRGISLNGNEQLLFRDWNSAGQLKIEFVVSNASSSTQVWDITDPLEPKNMSGNFSGNEFRFINDGSRLREYVAFNNSGFLQPTIQGTVANQDLHNSSPADLLVITHVSLLAEAQRLINYHQDRGLLCRLVTTEQVGNEFGSGIVDPVSIRNFLKMYWDRYRNGSVKPKYCLLFGDASFDPLNRVKNNTNLVPAWENDNALDPLSSYASDDFYGYLDDNEDIQSSSVINLLDLGIGRVPAKNSNEAKNFVDKLISYTSPASFGPWRNDFSFIADDEDNNLHVQDAELITGTAAATAPVFNHKKVYLDAFRQESGAGGSRYPQANQVINSQAYNGTLIWNYNGHGGPGRLAEENILDASIVNSWNNPNRLPLFITATCDFAPYDNPLINSLGENILLRQGTGAIALMTTTRPVFAFSNRILNNNYLRFALQRDAGGRYPSLGEAVREAKNFTYQNSTDIANNRKFTLLGDPALSLSFPLLKVKATSINGVPVAQADTLSATELVRIEGEVTDFQNNLLTGFNGNVYPVLYDKSKNLSTLGNDPGSQPLSFQVQDNVLFRGKASVQNGRFSFSFRMPRDINYQYGNGKLSLYAEDSTKDGNGAFTDLIIGGALPDNSGDRVGPVIRAFLNDETFVNGGLTNQHPVLILRLSDSSGINTATGSIDHDIVATLDNDNRNYFVLNDYYQTELNSYQQGRVRFQMPGLTPGPHTLKIKAWDVLNNSSESSLDFTVEKDEALEIAHVLNYPNPFSTHTTFWFEHNKPGIPLHVRVTVMTITGRIVRTIEAGILTTGNRSSEIEWDGRDDQGDRLGRGVYLYKLRVSAANYKSREILEKLVIF